MLSVRECVAEEEEPWECVVQYENVDWNDLLDAEEAGDPDALQRLRSVGSDASESEEPVATVAPPLSGHNTPLSYAQVLGPSHTGIKRRFHFSPSSGQRAGRSPKCSRLASNSPGYDAHTNQTEIACSPIATPEGASENLRNNGMAQRRLFSSPSPASHPVISPGQPLEELTPHRLSQRQKQIDFGKNTVGYQRYIQTVPKWKRKQTDPSTPDKNKCSSTRAWQGQIRQWRRALHKYDPHTQETFTSSDAALCNV